MRPGTAHPWRRRFALLLREPIVQFLLLGGGLFLLQALLRPPGAASGGEIVVSDARVATLAQVFQRTWQRPPTQGELDGLIDDHIREEVLVREALALGLDRDDVIIRRRLRQKMEFLSDESASRLKPSERQLRAQLEADPDAYRRDGRISFRQIFLDPSERGEDLRREATELLSGLNGADAAPDPAEVGDSLALLPSRLDQAPRSEVTSLFGRSFADQLFQQKPGSWSGPLESGYGLHLVRIEAITPGDIPPLEDVRLQVERDWQSQQRREQGEKRYRSLLGKYNVRRPEINAAGQEQAP